MITRNLGPNPNVILDASATMGRRGFLNTSIVSAVAAALSVTAKASSEPQIESEFQETIDVINSFRGFQDKVIERSLPGQRLSDDAINLRMHHLGIERDKIHKALANDLKKSEINVGYLPRNAMTAGQELAKALWKKDVVFFTSIEFYNGSPFLDSALVRVKPLADLTFGDEEPDSIFAHLRSQDPIKVFEAAEVIVPPLHLSPASSSHTGKNFSNGPKSQVTVVYPDVLNILGVDPTDLRAQELLISNAYAHAGYKLYQDYFARGLRKDYVINVSSGTSLASGHVQKAYGDALQISRLGKLPFASVFALHQNLLTPRPAHESIPVESYSQALFLDGCTEYMNHPRINPATMLVGPELRTELEVLYKKIRVDTEAGNILRARVTNAYSDGLIDVLEALRKERLDKVASQ